MKATTPSVAALARGLLQGALAASAAAIAIGICIGYPCASTGLRYGMWLDRCPATDLRLEVQVEARDLVRGEEGTVIVRPRAVWLEGDGSSPRRMERGFSRGARVELALVDAEGAVQPDLVVGAAAPEYEAIHLPIRLPHVVDGPYRLRAAVTTGFERVEVDLDLPLYVPAVAHVSSDRPLYRPGQEVNLRSVLLARTDLAPLVDRPGRWRILAPDQTEMHVERGRADAFGVAATTFPLDSRAETGTWTAIWESGGASDRVSFDVRPFRLPRLTVEASAGARWYGIGDVVWIEGVARYTSGAPVVDAPVEVQLRRAEGRWPAPLAWEAPLVGRTGLDGTFRVEVGEVPPDLIERAVYSAQVRITEEAGEVAAGAARLVLSRDDLMVQAVTELGDGLVGGFNNRAYLRVLAPDGQPLPGVDVAVTNPWDPAWPQREGRADADAVVALQVDPGKPVTVVHPAPPVRVRPLAPEAPTLLGGEEIHQRRSLQLDERRALDRRYPAIADCGVFAVGARQVKVGVAVEPSGAVRQVLADAGDAVSACVVRALGALRMPAGPARTYALTFRVPDSLRPHLQVSARAAVGSENAVKEALDRAALQARTCLPRGAGADGREVLTVHWSVRRGQRGVSARIDEMPGSGLSPSVLGCVRSALQRVELAEPPDEEALGVATAVLSVPRPPGSRPLGPTTQIGYELKVVAHADGERVGETRLVLPEGTIPPLRLRATPSIARPGQRVEIELFRGPGFQGKLPEKLYLMHGTRRVAEAAVDGNKATFEVPMETRGFLHVQHGGSRVVVLVQPAEVLSLALSTDRPSYRPGEVARLRVETRLGDRPTAAAVGLAGVDSALAQLAPLLGPDDWGRVTVRASSDQPAFGAFDPRALSLGQVRGEHAAQAAVLRITQVPSDPGGDVAIRASGRTSLDAEVALSEAFYRVMERLIPRVRKWEADAPEGEVMQPARMVAMWGGALAELRAEGKPATDAFGRPLTLAVLPADLLQQVAPRQVVADGTRLPEDLIDWRRYVSEEVAR